MRWGFHPLDIYDPRERIAVRAADLALGPGLLPLRLLPATPLRQRSTRILSCGWSASATC